MTVSMHTPNPERASLAQQVAQYLAQGGQIEHLPSGAASEQHDLAHITRTRGQQLVARMRNLNATWESIARHMACTVAEVKQLHKEHKYNERRSARREG